MKGLPTFRGYKYPREKRDSCFMCDETGPKDSMIRCYIYLTRLNELAEVIACELHDNSHRIVGNERPIHQTCSVSDCFSDVKTKGMCKSHYNRIYIGSPIYKKNQI